MFHQASYSEMSPDYANEPLGQWEEWDQTQSFHFGTSFVDGNTVWNIGGLIGDPSDAFDTISSADSISNQVIKYTISDSGVSSQESQPSWEMPLKSARNAFAVVGSRIYLFYGFTPETVGTEGNFNTLTGLMQNNATWASNPTDLYTPSEDKTLYFYRTK